MYEGAFFSFEAAAGRHRVCSFASVRPCPNSRRSSASDVESRCSLDEPHPAAAGLFGFFLWGLWGLPCSGQEGAEPLRRRLPSWKELALDWNEFRNRKIYSKCAFSGCLGSGHRLKRQWRVLGWFVDQKDPIWDAGFLPVHYLESHLPPSCQLARLA